MSGLLRHPGQRQHPRSSPGPARAPRNLVGLKMPRALEILDVTLRGIERGEIGTVEAIDALLTEELTIRENPRKMAVQMAKLSAIKNARGFDFAFQPSLDKSRILALAGFQTFETAADGGVEVERATNDAVAGARQNCGLRIARVASTRTGGLAMRRIEPFLAASFQSGVGRNKRPVFEDADLVGENVPFRAGTSTVPWHLSCSAIQLQTGEEGRIKDQRFLPHYHFDITRVSCFNDKGTDKRLSWRARKEVKSRKEPSRAQKMSSVEIG